MGKFIVGNPEVQPAVWYVQLDLVAVLDQSERPTASASGKTWSTTVP